MLDHEHRRRFWRAAFQSTVRLTTDAGTVGASLLDISLKGALIEGPATWHGRIGDACHIKLHLAEDAEITMWGQIAHIEGRHVGVRCDTLDLDSITHLRRLVELNSGDPELLDHEFKALFIP